MSFAVEGQGLSRRQLLVRAGALGAMMLCTAGLRMVNPETLSWLPFRTSCGAATGLPCIFCGTTRALHHLFRGEFAQALYFNWLAFPLAAAALISAVLLAAELILRHHIPLFLVRVAFTPRTAAAGAGILVVLWIVQVSLAVSMHKHELLNPNGVLYAWIVR